MELVLMGLGFILGMAFGGQRNGGFIGLIIATAIWLILMLVSFAGGDQILLATSKAQAVTHDVQQAIYKELERMVDSGEVIKDWKKVK